MSKKTLLSSIVNNVTPQKRELNLSIYRDYQFNELYRNPSLTKDERQLILNEFNKRDPLLINECINDLMSSIFMSYTSGLKNLIIEFIQNIYVKFPMRINMIQTLELNCDDGKKLLLKDCIELYLSTIEQVLESDLNYKKTYDVTITFLWDIYKQLLTKNFTDCDLEHFKDRLLNIGKIIINDDLIELIFRYKLVQNICKTEKISTEVKKYLCDQLINQDFSEYKYYLFICQILNNLKELELSHLEILKQLFSRENYLSYNAKADIADFMLSLDSIKYEESVIFGKKVIEELSFDKNTFKTIYNNQQNVHVISVDENITLFLEKLIDMNFEINIPSLEDEKAYSEFLEDFINKISEYSKTMFNEESQKRIQNSITRFIYDNTMYSKTNITLLQLLIRSYLYIQTLEYKEELMLRLCQELDDMSDTCTNGHLVRLVNVFSGYDMEMRMPVEEELKSCVFARLQKIIMEKSEEDQCNIYDCIGSSDEIRARKSNKIDTITDEDKRKNEIIDKDNFLSKEESAEEIFNKLLGKDINNLIEELRKEYVEQNIVEEHTFITYFRRALTSFQLGEKI